jgi:hypothetical protein
MWGIGRKAQAKPERLRLFAKTAAATKLPAAEHRVLANRRGEQSNEYGGRNQGRPILI